MADFSPHESRAALRGAGTCIAQSVSIDPITGAAAEHLMFSEEYIPAGSAFDLVLELGPCDKDDLRPLLALLHALDGTHDINLGAGGSHGFGRFEVTALKVEALTTTELCQYLLDPNAKPVKLTQQNINALAVPADPKIIGRRKTPLQIELIFGSAFAVHDPGLVGLGRTDTDDTKGVPRIEFSRDNEGKPRIPGRTLRGLVRHRARRILATILHHRFDLAPNDARKQAERQLNGIFGHTDAQSAVRFGEARIADGEQCPTREQTFNAIDRFTGGVADSKLYTATLAEPTRLRFALGLDPRIATVEDWWLGLGVLVLRDAIEGDLAIGWGKAKGLGAFRASFAGSSDWPSVLNMLRRLYPDNPPERWVDALHQHLENEHRKSQPSAGVVA